MNFAAASNPHGWTTGWTSISPRSFDRASVDVFHHLTLHILKPILILILTPSEIFDFCALALTFLEVGALDFSFAFSFTSPSTSPSIPPSTSLLREIYCEDEQYLGYVFVKAHEIVVTVQYPEGQKTFLGAAQKSSSPVLLPLS